MPIKLSMPDETPKGRRRLANAKGQSPQDKGIQKFTSGYAAGALSHQPITRNAQFAGGGASIAMSQPMFFSPLHTPQSWQIASRRKEVYQWSRFYYENEPKVAAGVDFYCFTPTMPVLMADGEHKAISAIQIGDIVRSHDGTTNKVVHVHRRDAINEVVNKIKVAGISLESSLTTTQGHKLLVGRNDTISYIHAGSVQVGDYLLTPAGYGERCINFGAERAWLLGLYAAEGCIIPYQHEDLKGTIRTYAKGIYIYLSLKERQIAEKVKNICEKYYGAHVTFSELTDTGTLKINVYSKAVADDLAGLCPGIAKDGTKRFAPTVLRFTEEDIKNVIVGFFDGDGHLSNNEGFVGVGVCRKLILQLASMCDMVCIPSSIGKYRGATSERQVIYRLRIPKAYCEHLSLSVKYKEQTYNENLQQFFYKDNFIWRKVTSVKCCIYNGDVFDLEVENSHSFVTNRTCNKNSQFPMNGFELECKNKQIRTYYEDVVKTLRLNYWLKLISHEYFLIGDVFPFLEIECKHCHGSGKLPSGKPCNHPDGKFKSITILNPDFVEIEDSPFPEQRALKMVPDDNIKKIVATGEPRAVYDRIPDQIKQLVSTGQPIPLSSRSASHIKHSETPYAKYGTSLLRRLFTVLAYKTKLMTANWIIAERLVLPVRVVKIGEKDRPASAEDIAEVQQQMAAVANDPNLTIVTHHAFDYEWYGSSGKIHNIQGEIEQIGKEILDGLMLNQALLNGEMGGYCHSEDTLTLTDDGFKRYDEITPNDRIATYNRYTGALEYHHYYEKVVYDWNDELVNFATDKIDIFVTPNHRMYAKPRGQNDFSIIPAKDIKARASFIGTVDKFEGEYVPFITIGERHIDIDTYCELVGYFVSEGYTVGSKNRQIGICQTKNGKAFEKIAVLMNSLGDFAYDESNGTWLSYDPELRNHLRDAFGDFSNTKRLNSFVKNLPSDKLQIILDCLVDGDGWRSHHKNRKHQQASYCTVSKKLAYDVAEIAFKCGYATKITKRKVRGLCGFNKKGAPIINKQPIYNIYIGSGFKGKKPTLQSKSLKYKNKEITHKQYTGKVYCFSVPNEIFVTMRNGKIAIQGNSAAQVGIETLIRRLEGWRHTLADWVEDHIFKPIAMMQGFIDEDATKELGKTVYLYPVIKWNDMQLRDKTNKLQMFMQLQDKSLISVETLLNEFDIDYDTEIERIRNQQMISSPGGPPGGAGGAGGAIPGGAGGGMPGGMGAPGGGMDPMGGAGGPPMGGAPGGGMGGPPGGGMGGAPMGGGGGGMGGMASGAGPGKVFKKGKAPKGPKPEDMPVQPASFVKLTRIEQKLWSTLQQMQLPFKLFGQYKQQVYGQQQPYVMDFALPEIQVDIECVHPAQLIPTEKGSRPAGAIEVGDKLLGRNGDFVEVEKKIVNKANHLIAIKAHGCLPIMVTANHPMLISVPTKISKLSVEPSKTRYRTYWEPGEKKFVSAGEIKAGDFLLLPKTKQSKEQLYIDFKPYNELSTGGTTKLLPDRLMADERLGWLIGIYVAEGCSEKDGSNVVFSFNISETEFIEKTQILLSDLFGFKSTVHLSPEEHGARVSLCSKLFSAFLSDSFGQYAPQKRLPAWMFSMPGDFIQGFLQGYLDGDGCVRETGAQRYISSSIALLSDLQRLLAQHGILGKMYNSRKPGTSCVFTKNGETKEYITAGLWELTVYPEVVKTQHYEDSDYFYLPVRAMLPIEYDGEVINFRTKGEGESNHTYCVGNLITHNSDGSIWHDRPGQKQKDAERDRKLAANGWRVIRFTEDAINGHLGEVQKVIEENIKEAAEERFSQRKKASSSEHVKYASLVDAEEVSDEQLRNLTDVAYTNCGSPINSVYGAIVQVIKKEANDETFQSASDSWTEEDQGPGDQLEGDISGEE